MKYVWLSLLLALALFGCSANRAGMDCSGNYANSAELNRSLLSGYQGMQDFAAEYPKLRNEVYFRIRSLDRKVKELDEDSSFDGNNSGDIQLLRTTVSDEQLTGPDEFQTGVYQTALDAQRHYISDAALNACQSGLNGTACSNCSK